LCIDYQTLFLFSSSENGFTAFQVLASKVLVRHVGFMETRSGFFQLVSAVVGLSIGVGVMTATVLLGVAALLQ
jgi:ABC-type lipoprotein release transport system permease subunit